MLCCYEIEYRDSKQSTRTVNVVGEDLEGVFAKLEKDKSLDFDRRGVVNSIETCKVDAILTDRKKPKKPE